MFRLDPYDKNGLSGSGCFLKHIWHAAVTLVLGCSTIVHATEQTPVDVLFDEQDKVVLATDSLRELNVAPSVVTVISEKQIHDMGAVSLIDVLESVPGFLVSYPSDIASGYTLTVRGLKSSEAEKVMLLINGHRVNNPFSGSWTFAFDEFPLEDVRRIEIIRGPGSALYGSGAMAAVINIITRDAESFHRNGVSTALGNEGIHRAHLTVGNRDDLRFFLSLDASESQGDHVLIAQDASGRAGYSNFWRRQGEAFLSMTSGQWSWFVMHMNKQRGSILDASNFIDRGSHLKIEQTFGSLIWHKDYADWNLRWRLDADLFHLDPRWFLFGRDVIQAKVKNLTVDSLFELKYAGLSNHELTAGLGFRDIRQFSVQTLINGVDVSRTSNHNRNASRSEPYAFVQDEWRVLPSLLLTAGVRMEQYSDVGSQLSPRFALVWAMNDHMDIKAMYGHAFRAPNFIELYSQNNPAILGNPSVRPERVDTFELVLGWHHDGWQVEWNGYYSRYRNLIARMPPDPHTYNIGRSTYRGVELSLRYDLEKDLYGSVVYIYQTGKDDNSGSSISGVPHHILTVSLDMPFLFKSHLHWDAHWIGRQSRPLADPRPVIPATWYLDAAWRLGSPAKGVSLLASVHNLLNRRVLSPMASPKVSDIPFQSRQWMISGKYEF